VPQSGNTGLLLAEERMYVRQLKLDKVKVARMSPEEGSLGVPECGTVLQRVENQSVMYVSEWVMSRRAVGGGSRPLVAKEETLEGLCTQL